MKTSNSPSFGWKSIMAAQDLLRAGLRKRIGSRYNTRVWSEPWIPVIPPRTPKDIGNNRDHDMFVNQLIDQTSKSWNTELLQSMFDPGDIPLIRSLRPSHNFSDDGFRWVHMKSGSYTVKSGYKLATQQKEEKATTRGHEPSLNGLKDLIWLLKTPRKIKLFLWQALSDSIAASSRLVDRHCG